MDEADFKRLIDNSAAETRRHFDVVAEDLRQEMRPAVESLSAKIDATSGRVDALASEMRNEFAEMRSMIRFSYAELDRRIRTLEDIVSDLQARIERLESASPHQPS